MTFELDEYHRNVSDETLMEDLQRIAKKLGKNTLTHEKYQQAGGKFGTTTLIRKMGSWNKALTKSGLIVKNFQGITDEALFENLEIIWITFGRQPKYAEIQKPNSQYSVGTYEKRFGSWRRALEKFVEYANKGQRGTVTPKVGSKEVVKVHKTKREGSLRQKFLVMRRDGFKCKLCGCAPATDPSVVLEVDHLLPWSKGGETVEGNLQTLCSKCNKGKSNLNQFST